MKTGVWIDNKVTHVIKIGENEEMISVAFEDVSYAYKEIERSGGATEIIRDRKLLERKKQALNLYFNAIVPELSNTEEIILIGPAQTGSKFLKFLKNEFPELGSRVKEVIKSHKMTDNQLKALVKSYFTS